MLNRKGFTLIEVFVSIILSGIIAYFLYIMMLTSYNLYKNLLGFAKETSDIRVCETYLRKSIKNACYINILPVAPADATTLDFGRQEFYWDSGTGTIKSRYVVDRYIVKNSTDPVKTGKFYYDSVNQCNYMPNPRESTKAGCHELLLQVYYTASNFSIVGQPIIREEQILTNLRVAYYYIPSNTEGGFKRLTLIKIGLDFDDYSATGKVYRHTRLFHFTARGYGLPS